MKCANCRAKITEKNHIFVLSQKKKMCYLCYSKIIESKLKANLSKHEMVVDDDVLILSEGNSAPEKAANFIFHKLFDSHPRINFGRRGKKVNYSTAEHIVAQFFESMSRKKHFHLKINGKEIYPVYNMTLEDVENYCKANNISYDKTEFYKKPVGVFLEKVKLVKPGGLYSFIKSLEEAEIIEA